MDKVEEETHLSMDPQYRSDAVSQLDRVTCEFREDLEHERAGVAGVWIFSAM